jgi:hypothetical protein
MDDKNHKINTHREDDPVIYTIILKAISKLLLYEDGIIDD